MSVIDLLTQNWEGGSNARYDVSKMQRNADGTYSYGGYNFDSEGRPLGGGTPGDGEGQWVPGRPGARGGNGPGGGAPGPGAPGGGGGPWYDQMKSLFQAQSQAEQANLRSGIQQMLIGMGLVPQGFDDKFGALDATTKALIQKNTDTGISTYARLREALGDNNRNITSRLTSKGLRRSGARGHAMRRGQLGFDRNLSDFMSQFMGDVGSKYGQFSNNEYARQLQLINAAMSNWGNWSPPSSPGPGPSSNTTSQTTTSSASSGPSPTGQTYTSMGDSYPIYDFGGGKYGF